MRVALFTDTLADVNGVARFLRTAAAHAAATGRELTVITSTRLEVPEAANIVNVRPRWSRPMPLYPQLELAVPARGALLRAAAALRPDLIHVSTPGPVGLAGRAAAHRLGVPLVGTYHTDFPAYLEHLAGHDSVAGAARAVMRWFYQPFGALFTRSQAYVRSVRTLGLTMPVHPLRAGIDIHAFHPSLRDERLWDRIAGARRGSVKMLYVGRVSVEKNLPFLADLWPRMRAALHARGVDAQLVVVGDGPYLPAMRAALAPHDALFTGIRHGHELAALYASSDAFVFPSRTDTLGQAVMEAQASGLPVLVTDEGGPREVVHHGITGFVLPARTPEAWIEHAARLGADADLRSRMGAAGRQFMETHAFSASFDHFWRIQQEIAARSASPPPLAAKNPPCHACSTPSPLASPS